jgi:hypothetical protein
MHISCDMNSSIEKTKQKLKKMKISRRVATQRSNQLE